MMIDGHLELAYDAVVNGRSHHQSLTDLRTHEKRRHPAGVATLTLPALAEAGLGLAFGTIFAPSAAKRSAEFGYHTPAQAEQMAQAQLDYYHRLADDQETIRLVLKQA